MQVGDEVLSINGKPAHDFSKVQLGVALLGRDQSASLDIRRLDGSTETIEVTPVAGEAGGGMLQMGVRPMPSLHVPASAEATAALEAVRDTFSSDMLAVLPGEQVLSIDNMEVGANDYPEFAKAVDRAGNEGRW